MRRQGRKIYILLCLERTWERGFHLENSIYGNSNNSNNSKKKKKKKKKKNSNSNKNNNTYKIFIQEVAITHGWFPDATCH